MRMNSLTLAWKSVGSLSHRIPFARPPCGQDIFADYDEIKKFTQDLRQALDNYVHQLAEQLRNNPQQLARPLDPNMRILSQQDLNNMIGSAGAADALPRI
jgi:Domain of unknown function (DUF4175)